MHRLLSSGRPASFDTTAAVALFDVGFAARAPVVFFEEAPSKETVAVLTDWSWAATEDSEVGRGQGSGGDDAAHFVCFCILLVWIPSCCYGCIQH